MQTLGNIRISPSWDSHFLACFSIEISLKAAPCFKLKRILKNKFELAEKNGIHKLEKIMRFGNAIPNSNC